MKKYIMLNPAKGAGSGFAKIDTSKERAEVRVNFSLPTDNYTVCVEKVPFFKHIIASGRMGSANIKKLISRKDIPFPAEEINAVTISRSGETILYGCDKKTEGGFGDIWMKIKPSDRLPRSVSMLLSHPHSRYLTENGHDVFICDKGSLIYLAIKSEFGKEPHPMLYAAHAATYRNGYWVVAISRGTGQYLTYNENELAPEKAY